MPLLQFFLHTRTLFFYHFAFKVTLRTYTPPPTPALSSPLPLRCTAPFLVLALYLPSQLLFYVPTLSAPALCLSVVSVCHALLPIVVDVISLSVSTEPLGYRYRSHLSLLSYSVCCKSIIVYSYITMRSQNVSSTEAPLLLQRKY